MYEQQAVGEFQLLSCPCLQARARLLDILEREMQEEVDEVLAEDPACGEHADEDTPLPVLLKDALQQQVGAHASLGTLLQLVQ
jgi:hypothetical protein